MNGKVCYGEVSGYVLLLGNCFLPHPRFYRRWVFNELMATLRLVER
jgi:hypothetical protein